MTDSYPFLTLSRRIQADYGDVLSYAEYVEHRTQSADHWHIYWQVTHWEAQALERLTSYQRGEVEQVLCREQYRRRGVYG